MWGEKGEDENKLPRPGEAQREELKKSDGRDLKVSAEKIATLTMPAAFDINLRRPLKLSPHISRTINKKLAPF